MTPSCSLWRHFIAITIQHKPCYYIRHCYYQSRIVFVPNISWARATSYIWNEELSNQRAWCYIMTSHGLDSNTQRRIHGKLLTDNFEWITLRAHTTMLCLIIPPQCTKLHLFKYFTGNAGARLQVEYTGGCNTIDISTSLSARSILLIATHCRKKTRIITINSVNLIIS